MRFFDILPSKVPFFRNEAKTEISSCIYSLTQPKLLLDFILFIYLFIFGACLGVVLKSFWSRIILAFYFYFFWISISNSDGVICEALLWAVCVLWQSGTKKAVFSAGRKICCKGLNDPTGVRNSFHMVFLLICWIIKTLRALVLLLRWEAVFRQKKEKL